ncbi:endospore germination permease [Cohnella herbarum]|uniref:Endospore germination permease n=1 Tax=Cohnella herbarum TaxID=2728023 RepID=A0A7Z2VHI5_9BACL|nr:endospore germination permease [Cohnella herbarum]QJD83142.1 endospore germination permease [Cohnella herbarum]
MSAVNSKISFLQACMILMLMNGLTNHVIVNPMLLDAAGRDSWISVIAAGVLFVPWCLFLSVFMKRSGQSELRPWLAKQTHPIVAWILTIPLIIQLYLIGAMTIVHTSAWTVTNYLPSTPKIVLSIVLTVLCATFAHWGIRVIAVMSGILLPFVILLGIFAGVSNYPEKNFNMLKPYLEFGISPVINGMIYAGGGFVEIIVLIALQHHINAKVRPLHLLIYSSIMVYIMVGPLFGAITEFGPLEAAKQMVSPFEQWRLVRLGSYVEHVDFFSVYQWLAGACVRISLSIFLVIDLLPLRNSHTKNSYIMLIALSYIVLSVVPINEYTFYLWMYRFYFPISLVVLLAVSIAWVSVSAFAKQAKGGKT